MAAANEFCTTIHTHCVLLYNKLFYRITYNLGPH